MFGNSGMQVEVFKAARLGMQQLYGLPRFEVNCICCKWFFLQGNQLGVYR